MDAEDTQAFYGMKKNQIMDEPDDDPEERVHEVEQEGDGNLYIHRDVVASNASLLL